MAIAVASFFTRWGNKEAPRSREAVGHCARCVSLASQPSPIALNEDDAEKDDEVELLHETCDVAARAPSPSTTDGQVGAPCTVPTRICRPVRRRLVMTRDAPAFSGRGQCTRAGPPAPHPPHPPPIHALPP